MKPAFDAIAFDVDGTLVDSTETSVRLLREVLRAAGRDVSMEEMGFARHATDAEVWAHFGLGARGEEMDAALSAIQHRLWAEESLYPGTVELLQRLKARGIFLGLVSNRTDEQLRRDGSLAPYRELADICLSCESAGVGKPDPAPLHLFLEKAGCAADRALMVGDASPDAQAARAAGMPFALALWGAAEGDLPADYRLEKPEDLEGLL